MTNISVQLCCYIIIALFFLTDCSAPTKEEAFSVASVMSGDSTDVQFAKADTIREFIFPEDHAAHPEYKTEWWYITGNLSDSTGKEFGFQWTLFRFGFMPASLLPKRTTDIAASAVMMGHFALTDIHENEFYSFERFSRADNILGGYSTAPYSVWLLDWKLQGTPNNLFPARLTAKEQSYSLDLTLDTIKSFILQGNNGLSQKGSQRGNASYYYSYPRLSANGSIILNGNKYSVQGLAWLDREWSTSALDSNQQGWDWFSLQFDDQTEVMCYILRDKQGKPTATSSATFILPNGSKQQFKSSEISLKAIENHTMSKSGRTYPTAWELRLGSNLLFTMKAAVQEQEHLHTFQYWEGALRAKRLLGSTEISGKGYGELTGY